LVEQQRVKGGRYTVGVVEGRRRTALISLC
jgi:hypothetical protein